MDWSKEPDDKVVDPIALCITLGLFVGVIIGVVLWLDTIPGAGGSP